MRQILTPDELRRGDLIPPGWYPTEIVDYEEKEAETDGSTNCFFHFKIVDGDQKGIVIRRLFNEKAFGFGKNLWAALELPYDNVRGYEFSTELFKQTIGHKVMVYVKRGKSNKGNEFNDAQDFKKMGA
ncbi:MAG: DUF669 domain-containing protein [Paenisporosarcina sp.]